ncbi:MAG: hypothetical protein ACFFE3_11385 [Candidatus Thorarchaeota archaeon]
MSSLLNQLESPSTGMEYQARNECRGTTIYCILSLALLIVSVMLNTPEFSESVPGGSLTVAMISMIVFIFVLFLCIKQARRP